MAAVSTYLNFRGQAEKAFLFYRKVFGTEFNGEVSRFSSMPDDGSGPSIPEKDKNLIMHIELPLVGGFLLMGSDVPDFMDFDIRQGNKMHINLHLDSPEETRHLFGAISEGGTITQNLQPMFWGALYGSCTDRFGIQWMFNCPIQTNDAL